jgi:hypothetical protein
MMPSRHSVDIESAQEKCAGEPPASMCRRTRSGSGNGLTSQVGGETIPGSPHALGCDATPQWCQ